jgi:hypothetical protein
MLACHDPRLALQGLYDPQQLPCTLHIFTALLTVVAAAQ